MRNRKILALALSLDKLSSDKLSLDKFSLDKVSSDKVSWVHVGLVAAALFVSAGAPSVGSAQEMIPVANGMATYHTAPRYRDSESHPLRIVSYIVHPVGWLAREVIFRPLSYFASSTETTRSIMGYREPFDYRQPECFTADDSAPDCRSLSPFNYDAAPAVPVEAPVGAVVQSEQRVYFPNVGFDFDKRTLSDLGKGRVHEIARTLQNSGAVKVVLQGHTDYMGTDAYNEKLGLDRAEAVRSELVALGVSADRLSTVTFGESQPVFAEQEDWARAVNRRVEVHVGDAAPAQ